MPLYREQYSLEEVALLLEARRGCLLETEQAKRHMSWVERLALWLLLTVLRRWTRPILLAYAAQQVRALASSPEENLAEHPSGTFKKTSKT